MTLHCSTGERSGSLRDFYIPYLVNVTSSANSYCSYRRLSPALKKLIRLSGYVNYAVLGVSQMTQLH